MFPEQLSDGYKAFFHGRLRQERARYEKLAAEGQTPQTMIISCCDSRAAPETIFSSAPGEIFVVRNVANIVPPYQPDGDFHGVSAALEFAVQHLAVRNIVVMGHGRCGGVQAYRAMLEGQPAKPLSDGDFIGKWISLLEPASHDIRCGDNAEPEVRQRALEEASIRQSVNHLLSFPYIKDRAAEGDLALHGAWFDISSGELWTMDRENGSFSRSEV